VRNAARVTWWGHSTVWLEDSGVRLLTDPLLTDRLAHLRRAAGPRPVLPGPPDAVLVSHLHADHLHLASLRQVPGDPVIVLPRGTADFVRKGLGRPRARVVELSPGEEVPVGAVRVRAVRAHHHDVRGPWSRLRATPIGFTVEGSLRTWYAGDTGLFDEMAGISPVDLALIPVGGWGPSLGETHLDPAQAAEAVHRAKAATAVPVHYGTFWPVGFSRVRPHLFHSPAREFVRHAATVAPHTTVRVLRHGETTTVGSGA
jgi:L-ascorbate metabolism protein UlaG (beta-lactamase superfamily)